MQAGVWQRQQNVPRSVPTAPDHCSAFKHPSTPIPPEHALHVASPSLKDGIQQLQACLVVPGARGAQQLARQQRRLAAQLQREEVPAALKRTAAHHAGCDARVCSLQGQEALGAGV